MTPRDLTADEYRLAEVLVRGSVNSSRLSIELSMARVVTLSDGDMGSVRFLRPDADEQGRKFAQSVGKIEFNDTDGTKVLVSLDVDHQGHLFELDVWKTDFSPLIHIPDLLT